MSKGQRIGLIALAVVVVAVAFVVARPDDDEEKSSPPAATATTETDGSGKAQTPTATTESRPEHRIRLRGHKPVGGVQRIEVKSGDFVRITVESDAPDEVHLHGYDIEKEAAPGAPARFSFRAKIEGEFELEAHESEAVVANLVVEPS